MRELISLETIYRLAYRREVAPYPFQRALAHDSGFEVLIAPTGLGKTAGVTLGWVWHRACPTTGNTAQACLMPADAHPGRADRT
jgi:hypothetical protein